MEKRFRWLTIFLFRSRKPVRDATADNELFTDRLYERNLRSGSFGELSARFTPEKHTKNGHYSL